MGLGVRASRFALIIDDLVVKYSQYINTRVLSCAEICVSSWH